MKEIRKKEQKEDKMDRRKDKIKKLVVLPQVPWRGDKIVLQY